MLTTAQVAHRMKVSSQTVTKWIQDGKLKATKDRRAYRIDPSDFEAFIASYNDSMNGRKKPGRKPGSKTNKKRGATRKAKKTTRYRSSAGDLIDSIIHDLENLKEVVLEELDEIKEELTEAIVRALED